MLAAKRSIPQWVVGAVAKLLLKNGADWEVECMYDGVKTTALLMACSSGNTPVVEVSWEQLCSVRVAGSARVGPFEWRVVL